MSAARPAGDPLFSPLPTPAELPLPSQVAPALWQTVARPVCSAAIPGAAMPAGPAFPASAWQANYLPWANGPVASLPPIVIPVVIPSVAAPPVAASGPITAPPASALPPSMSAPAAPAPVAPVLISGPPAAAATAAPPVPEASAAATTPDAPTPLSPSPASLASAAGAAAPNLPAAVGLPRAENTRTSAMPGPSAEPAPAADLTPIGQGGTLTREMLNRWERDFHQSEVTQRLQAATDITEFIRNNPDLMASAGNEGKALKGLLVKMARDEDKVIRGMALLSLEAGRVPLSRVDKAQAVGKNLRAAVQALANNARDPEETDVARRILAQWAALTQHPNDPAATAQQASP